MSQRRLTVECTSLLIGQEGAVQGQPMAQDDCPSTDGHSDRIAILTGRAKTGECGGKAKTRPARYYIRDKGMSKQILLAVVFFCISCNDDDDDTYTTSFLFFFFLMHFASILFRGKRGERDRQ